MTTKPSFFKARINSLPVTRLPQLSQVGASGYLHLLDSDEGSTWRTRAIGEAERDRFSDALHQYVQRLGLRMAAAQFRNIGDEVAFFILFDDDGEWIGALGHGLNYTPQTAETIAEPFDGWGLNWPGE